MRPAGTLPITGSTQPGAETREPARSAMRSETRPLPRVDAKEAHSSPVYEPAATQKFEAAECAIPVTTPLRNASFIATTARWTAERSLDGFLPGLVAIVVGVAGMLVEVVDRFLAFARRRAATAACRRATTAFARAKAARFAAADFRSIRANSALESPELHAPSNSVNTISATSSAALRPLHMFAT